VVETNYCVTLDRVPEQLYPDIAANEAQRAEWVRLFAIDEIEGDLTQPGYSEPLTVEFLKANPSLVLDTAHFSAEFKERLLASFDDLDEQTDGLLIHSENFQALTLLSSRYAAKVQSIYIDPPYNTDASAIIYKNGYKDSSWLALMENRLALGQQFLRRDGIVCVAIDDTEFARLKAAIDARFGSDKVLGVAVVRSNPAGRSTPNGFAEAHEYALFFASTDASSVGRLPRTERQLARYSEKDDKGCFEWVNFRKHGGREATREARPRMYFPIFARAERVRLPSMQWSTSRKEWELREQPLDDEEVVWPLAHTGKQLRWKWGPESFADNPGDFKASPDRHGKTGVYMKSRMHDDGMLPVTWWDRREYSATEYGTNLLTRMFGDISDFSFPKSPQLVMDCLRAANAGPGAVVLDYFAGSGTTGHAVISLNEEDSGRRRFVLVEMGAYFTDVLVPRLKKRVFAAEWEGGRPKPLGGSRGNRTSIAIKVLRLESYEDTLNNLTLRRTKEQEQLLSEHPDLREDYALRYMLDVESEGSASLLDLTQFEDPFGYTLEIGQGSVGETRPVVVDLVETFNYLIGLRVQHIDAIRGFKVVEGASPQGERVLVIWRNTREKSNAALDEFFQKQGYSTRDTEFDVVYVNGDNNLENLRRPDETWKVRLIEDEFKRLMFDVQDV